MTSPGSVRFNAILRPTEQGAYVELPQQAVEGLGASGRTSVVGTVDGVRLVGQVMPYVFEGDGRKVVLGITKQMRAATGKIVGESVEVELSRDDAPRTTSIVNRSALDPAPCDSISDLPVWPPVRWPSISLLPIPPMTRT